MTQTLTFALVDTLQEDLPARPGWRHAARYGLAIGNVPVICHVVGELADGGIEQVRVLTRDSEQAQLQATLGDGGKWGVQISYAEPQGPEHDRALLIELEQALTEQAVLVQPGDCLFPGQVAPLRERFSTGDVDVLLLGRVAAPTHHGPRLDRPQPDPLLPHRAALLEGDPLLTVDPLLEEGLEPQPRAGFDTAVALGTGAAPLIRRLARTRSTRHPLIESLTADCRFGVFDTTAHWCYSDSLEAILLGNQVVLDVLSSAPDQHTFGVRNQITGRVAIDPSARISDSRIRGPVVIGERAVVEDSFIGPYTAIGPEVVLAGAEIDNTIVLAHARIEHPGYRIEGSLIAERATISRSFDLPKGVHVQLGPDSRVIFS